MKAAMAVTHPPPVMIKNNRYAGTEVIKLFSCSTQLSMKFQLLTKTKMLRKINTFLAFKLSDVLFIMLIHVKMPTIVGILTFMSMMNFMLSWVETSFLNSDPGLGSSVGYMSDKKVHNNLLMQSDICLTWLSSCFLLYVITFTFSIQPIRKGHKFAYIREPAKIWKITLVIYQTVHTNSFWMTEFTEN